MTTRLHQLRAREILDSRGRPTLEVICHTDDGAQTRASVPTGASIGAHEAKALRDGDTRRFNGRGVRKAIAIVEGAIASELADMDVTRQPEIDDRLVSLDGTANKSRLGANAMLGVSMALARAGAKSAGRPLYRHLGSDDPHRLPVPCLNVLNGGVHAAWQGADFQEYMIVPHGAGTFAETLRWAAEIYHSLKRTLKGLGMISAVGDEGGFAPRVKSNQQPLDWIMASIDATGLRAGDDVSLAIDTAASALWQNGYYQLAAESRALTADELIEYYVDLMTDYPIRILEDGVREDDRAAWQRLNTQLGRRLTLVGDDLFVTQQHYIERGIQLHCANAVLIRPNQVGTLTETIRAVQLAHHAGWRTMVSHRSGETNDSFIADLAVGLGSHFIKAGAPAQGERVAKYNRLMAIEAELGAKATFAG